MKSATFIAFNVTACIVFIIGIVLDHIFYNSPIIVNTVDTLNWASPLIVAICAMIITAISLSLTLQNEKICGLPMRKFSNLRQRVAKYFSFQSICVIFIVLITLLVICYFSTFYISCFIVLGMMLAFCLYITIDEIPIILHKEKQINQILALYANEYVIRQVYKINDIYTGNKEDDDSFFTALGDLLFNKNIIYILNALSLKDVEKEKMILKSLMSIFYARVSSLSNSYNKELINNEYNTILNSLNFLNLDKLGDAFNHDISCSSLITGNILAVKNNPYFDYKHSQLSFIFKGIIDKIPPIDTVQKQNELDFYFNIIQNIIIESVSNGDFYFLEILLKNFSTEKNFLNNGSPLSYLFCNICIFIMYLLNFENDYPKIHRDKLISLINKKYNIEKHKEFENLIELQIYIKNAYKNLNLNINYEMLKHYFKLNDWQYYIDLKAHWVALTDEFLCDWYLLMCIILSGGYFNINRIQIVNEKTKLIFRNTLQNWFNNDKTLNMNYLNKFQKTDLREGIDILVDDKDLQKSLFEFKNNLNFKQIEETIQELKVQNKQKIANELKANIEKRLEKVFGLNKKLEVINESQKCVSCIIEMNIKAINFYEAYSLPFSQNIMSSVQNIVKDNAQKTVKIKRDINEIIETLKLNEVDSTNTMSFRVERNTKITEQNKQFIRSLKFLPNSYLPQNTYLKQSTYAFNYVIDDFLVNDLNGKDLEDCINWYQKDDGQYFYNNTYMNREQIETVVRDMFCLIRMPYRVEVKCDKEHCFILNIDNYKQKQQ